MISKFYRKLSSALKVTALSDGVMHSHTTIQQNLHSILFEKMADPILLIRAKDDKFIDCNEATLRFLAYPNKDALMNLSPWQISPEFQANGKSSKDIAKELHDIVYEHGFHRFEWQHLRYTGELVSVEVTLTLINIDNEQLFHVAWRDLTERNQANAILQESELRWKFALEGSGDGVWDWNIQTDHAVYSKRWKEMLGYAEDDIQPTNQEWQTRIHPEDQAMVASSMRSYLSGAATIYRVEYRLKCKDESYIWILGRGMVVSRDLQGNPLRMIGTHTDITMIKKAELILIESRQQAVRIASAKTLDLITRDQELEIITQRFQTSFDNAPIGVVNMSINGYIMEVNQSFCDFLLYNRDDLINIRFKKLVHSTDQKAYVDNINNMLVSEDSATTLEIKQVRKNGEQVWGQLTIKLIHLSNGQPNYFILIIENVTERKHKDEQLLAAKELAETLAKTKSQFLANMSHEIRTPMNAIIGLSDLALLEENSTELSTHVQHINTAATHLLAIINDILDLSKLEAGRIQLMPAAFDLDELLSTTHYLLLNAAVSKNLHLSLNKDQNVPSILIGDSLRLRQVLINLVGNAIKFTDQGSVTLSISLLESIESNARILFAVKDTGIGITPEQQTKLFKPFSQLDDGYSRNFGGTGLGLVISQDLVTLMGGEIKIDSNFGMGSCFSFELVLPVVPLVKLEEDDVSTEIIDTVLPVPIEISNQLRILVAEDDFLNQLVIGKVLDHFGVSYVLVNNGLEVLSQLEENNFDIILMDLHMPMMNGYEATLEIRNIAEYKAKPIIALTASVTDEAKQHCIEIGMNDFIEKPLTISKLHDKLKYWTVQK